MPFACYYVLKTLFLQNIILLVVLLLVVPTDLTEYTEAYGFKLLESTERIDAARHTTEGTELIACVASPRLSVVRRKQSFLYSVRSVGTTYKRTTSYKLYVHYTNITRATSPALAHKRYRQGCCQ